MGYLRKVLEFWVSARDLSRAGSCSSGFVGVGAIGAWVLDLGKQTWMDFGWQILRFFYKFGRLRFVTANIFFWILRTNGFFLDF